MTTHTEDTVETEPSSSFVPFEALPSRAAVTAAARRRYGRYRVRQQRARIGRHLNEWQAFIGVPYRPPNATTRSEDTQTERGPSSSSDRKGPKRPMTSELRPQRPLGKAPWQGPLAKT